MCLVAERVETDGRYAYGQTLGHACLTLDSYEPRRLRKYGFSVNIYVAYTLAREAIADK